MTVQTDVSITGYVHGHLAIERLPGVPHTTQNAEDLQAVCEALFDFGVSGRYATLADAVQALGRRAEAAEVAASEEATLSEQLLPIVRALNENMTADIETIVLTALAVQRELTRTVKLYVEEPLT